MRSTFFEQGVCQGMTTVWEIEKLGLPHAEIVECYWTEDTLKKYKNLHSHVLFINHVETHRGSYEECEDAYINLMMGMYRFSEKERRFVKR